MALGKPLPSVHKSFLSESQMLFSSYALFSLQVSVMFLSFDFLQCLFFLFICLLLG